MPDRSIDEVFGANRDRIMALPGVVGVGIGELNGSPCVRVFVDGGVAGAQGEIPSELDGYPVDVVESGPFTALGPA